MTPPPAQKQTAAHDKQRHNRSQSQRRPTAAMSRQQQRSRRRLSTFSVITAIGASRTPVFNIVRVAIYLSVMVFSIICLGIAVHFQAVLAPTDLTRFVPFAIFVTCASMVLILGLLGLTFMRRANPVSTRLELASLGLVGFFWFSLGIFTATSASADADVECFVGDDDTEAIEFPGFTTDSFQAQYRVLESFALLNAILLLGFLFLLLALAMRQHRKGYKQVWLISVTDYPWFGGGKPPAAPKRLPLPVVTREKEKSKNVSRNVSRPTAHAAPALTPQRSTSRPTQPKTSRTLAVAMGSAPVRQDSRRTPGAVRPPPPRKENPAMMVWVPPPPEKARTRDDRTRPSGTTRPATRR